jgi:ribosomal protein S18 acetylase RimI-like enzyme
MGQSLSAIIKDETQLLDILTDSFCPEFALVALHDARLVGLLGFSGKNGSFTEGLSPGSLFNRLGWWAGLRALFSRALLSQQPRPGELLVESIVVTAAWRRQGIGTALLEQLADYGRQHDYQRIGLEIAKDNTAARHLVERLGFKPVTIQHTPIFWNWLGLEAGIALEKQL